MATIDVNKVKEIDQIPDQKSKVLAAATMYAECGFYIVPIRPNSKILPGHEYNFSYVHATNKVKTVRKWFGPGADFEGWNIGIATGMEGGCFVVDMDIKETVNGLDQFKELCPEDYEYLGPMQSTPSGGIHLFYTWAENCSSSTGKIASGIDTRGGDRLNSKGHVVAWPSVVDGNRYTWSRGGCTDFPPQFVIDKLGTPWERTLKPAKNKGKGRGNENVLSEDSEEQLSLAQLKLILDYVHPDSINYDDWVKCLQAIHTQYPNDKGRDLAYEWSKQSAVHEFNEVHKRWPGFTESGPVRVGTLIYYAKEAGLDTNRIRLEPSNKDELDSIVEDLNKEFAVIPLGSDVFVLQEIEVPPELSRIQAPFRIFKKQGFRSLLENQTAPVVSNDGKRILKTSFADIFLAHENRRAYPSGMGMFPDRPQRYMGYFNMWQGFTVQPKKGDWSMFRDHIKNIICAGDTKVYSWVLDWMADLYQDPANPKGCAIVMHGIEGCGKGTFAQIVGEAFGTHFKHLLDEEHLIGRFNGHLADAVVVFADEITYGGNKKTAGKLKGMVTEKYLISERKGVDAVQFHNCTHLMVSSNEDWFIPAGPDSRRWLVLDVAPDRASDKQYFTDIVQLMHHSGGIAAMMYDLLEREVKSDLRKAPVTTALKYQRGRYVSNDPILAWISGQIMMGNLAVPDIDNMNDHHTWPDNISSSDAYQHCRKWCIENKMRPPPDAVFGKSLRELGFGQTRVKRAGRRLYAYTVPLRERLIQNLESKGLYLDIDEGQYDED